MPEQFNSDTSGGIVSTEVEGGELSSQDIGGGQSFESFTPTILSEPENVVDDTSDTRAGIDDTTNNGAVVSDTVNNPVTDATTVSAETTVADYLKQLQEATALNSADQNQAKAAGDAAGAQFTPLIDKAEESAKQGKANTEVQAGERGGFMNTQFSGVAALKRTQGKTFAGAGGAIERVFSAYDAEVNTLKKQQIAAINAAQAAERKSIKTGKRSDLAAAQKMYTDAQDLSLKIQSAALKQNQFALDAVNADKANDLAQSNYELAVSKYLSGEERADTKDELDEAKFNLDVAKVSGEWLGAPTLAAKKLVADNAFKQLGVELSQKKFDEMVENNDFNQSLAEAKLALDKSKFDAENAGVDVGQFADNIIEGTMNYNDIVKTIGKGSAQALNVALSNRKAAYKDAFRETDNPIYTIKNSAGGKQVVSTDQQMLGKIFTVMGQLSQVKDAFDTAAARGKTGAFKGKITDLKFWDEDKAVIDAALAGVVPTVARGIFGEVGVLTDNDINNYKKAIASVKTPEEARDKIFNMLLTNIGAKATQTLKSNANAKFDVSGYTDDYESMMKELNTKLGVPAPKVSTNPALYSDINGLFSAMDETQQTEFETKALDDMKSAGISDINDYFDFLREASLDKDMYQSPTFNNVDSDTNTAEEVSKIESIPDDSSGGQCGRFVNNLTGLGVGDSFDSKMAKMDETITEPEAGMVFTMPYKDSGHCGIITSIDGDMATVKDSNWGLDEKVTTHEIALNKMTGFARL